MHLTSGTAREFFFVFKVVFVDCSDCKAKERTSSPCVAFLGFVYFAFSFWVQTSAVWLAAWHFVVCLEEGEGGGGDGEGENSLLKLLQRRFWGPE